MDNMQYIYKIITIDGKDVVISEYPVIVFNKVYLPPGAIFIDYCASANILPYIDSNTSLWFWKFTNCVGVTKSSKSDDVIRYSENLKVMLLDNEDKARTLINEKYGSGNSATIFKWWLDTLVLMINSSKKRSVSTWYGIPAKN
jgi:hypothetical protein